MRDSAFHLDPHVTFNLLEGHHGALGRHGDLDGDCSALDVTPFLVQRAARRKGNARARTS